MRPPATIPSALAVVLLCLAVVGCGSGKKVLPNQSTPVQVPTTGSPDSPAKVGIPLLATKNTTRVAGGDPIADAAAVALAVYPSSVAGTHPESVVLAPTDDWEAALAASVFMYAPLRAPLLLSGPATLPSVTATALRALNPSGARPLGGARLLRIGDVPTVSGFRATSIASSGPYAVTAAIDHYASALAGTPSPDVVVASADHPEYAMPAAGWAAESGNPLLFVSGSGIPPETQQALRAHGHPHIYVLGPPSIVSDDLLAQLGKFGTVKRVGDQDPAANSATFASYRDPPCPYGQPCVHVPGSFGWALRSPGHGYVLMNANRPLDAAAAAPLSATGDFGPQLVLTDPTKLPSSLLNFFLNYATPGYTLEGPTAAVYNHGWMIGDQAAISGPVQADVDALLQAIPQQR